MAPNRPVIEPGIAPLVEALNAWPELETFASCGGHPGRGERPYVAFRTTDRSPTALTLQFLEELAGTVEQAARANLWHYWTMHAWFHPDGGLVFALEADGLWRRFWWRRSRVRQDVETLGGLLRPPTARSTGCTETRVSVRSPRSTASAARGTRDPDTALGTWGRLWRRMPRLFRRPDTGPTPWTTPTSSLGWGGLLPHHTTAATPTQRDSPTTPSP